MAIISAERFTFEEKRESQRKYKNVLEIHHDWSMLKKNWHIHALVDTNGATCDEITDVRWRSIRSTVASSFSYSLSLSFLSSSRRVSRAAKGENTGGSTRCVLLECIARWVRTKWKHQYSCRVHSHRDGWGILHESIGAGSGRYARLSIYSERRKTSGRGELQVTGISCTRTQYQRAFIIRRRVDELVRPLVKCQCPMTS